MFMLEDIPIFIFNPPELVSLSPLAIFFYAETTCFLNPLKGVLKF